MKSALTSKNSPRKGPAFNASNTASFNDREDDVAAAMTGKTAKPAANSFISRRNTDMSLLNSLMRGTQQRDTVSKNRKPLPEKYIKLMNN